MSSDASPTPTRSRIQPHHLVIGLGIAFAALTLASGIAGALEGWEDDSPITREVFSGIPGALQVAFYTLIPVLIVYGAFAFADRVKNWERGAPDRRRTTTKNAKRRLADFRAGVYMQTLLRDPAAGVMHSLIYFGFLVLLGVTTVLEIDHQLPESAKFLHGEVYQAYAFVGDAAGAVFLVGIVWAIVRRYVQRPYRIRIKTKPEHAVILGMFFVIGVTGFVTEMFRIASEGRPTSRSGPSSATRCPRWSTGYARRRSTRGTRRCGRRTSWPSSSFLVILPITMLRHMFTSPLNMYLRDRSGPKGAMKPMPNLMETELESLRRRDRRGLHLEAAARHRRLHDVRPLHVGLPGARHRQAARPARDRAQDGRGHGRDRRPRS